MHVDRYRNFAELIGNEIQGKDFTTTLSRRDSSPIAIIAPHGGKIEPRTAEIASQIAGEDFNLYLFEGIKSKENYTALHITSHHFDDPSCIALLSSCETVVAIHGCTGTDECVMLGGLDMSLKERIAVALQTAGVQAKIHGHNFQAVDQYNICNRGRTRQGVQLELTRALRASGKEIRVVSAVRDVLLTIQHGT